MKKAYVILAHKNAAQLRRLITALHDGHSVFFIHIDGRSDITSFASVADFGNSVQFVPRVKTTWAGFGLVEAVLNGMMAVKKCREHIEHVFLLSGQDYPIKSNDYINDFIADQGEKIFIEYFQLPNFEKWKPNGGLYRVNKYFMGLKPHQRFAAKAANAVAGVIPAFRRKQYKSMKPFAGSMWWSLPIHAVNYILDFVNKHPRYTAFHKYTFAADEVFFQSILLNAREDRIASAIVNNDKRFIRWKDISSAHPEILSKNDLGDMQRSDALFARKFDMSKHPEVFDLIDAHCHSCTTTIQP
jgi:hypothetical protein